LAVGDDVVPVSNLNKALWPGRRGRAVTKRDLLRYLVRVSPYMLPHLEGRPAFVTRFPDGVTGESFYQKVWEDRPPYVRTVRIWSKDQGRARDYLLIANLPTLLWLGQMAGLEIHLWMSRTTPGPDGQALSVRYGDSEAALEASRLNYPDFLVLDLDAYLYSGREATGAEPELHRRGFNRVRTIAFEVRRALGGLDLPSYVKTSGRTGLHCYIPIQRRLTFDHVREMAESVGHFLEGLFPDDVTLAWAVRDRAGKVFVDYNQNVRGKSLAAPFSPRRHPFATVSMPVSWDELPHVYPTDFTIHTVPDLLAERGDPWADILATKADLDSLIDGRPTGQAR
jgi:bifunctional non-homologous end joining protein LigD